MTDERLSSSILKKMISQPQLRIELDKRSSIARYLQDLTFLKYISEYTFSGILKSEETMLKLIPGSIIVWSSGTLEILLFTLPKRVISNPNSNSHG